MTTFVLTAEPERGRAVKKAEKTPQNIKHNQCISICILSLTALFLAVTLTASSRDLRFSHHHHYSNVFYWAVFPSPYPPPKHSRTRTQTNIHRHELYMVFKLHISFTNTMTSNNKSCKYYNAGTSNLSLIMNDLPYDLDLMRRGEANGERFMIILIKMTKLEAETLNTLNRHTFFRYNPSSCISF